MGAKQNKTIIILSSPRSGSRLLYEYLKENSSGSDHLFNLNFWGLALNAINGDDEIFKTRLKQYFSYLKIPEIITMDSVFLFWDNIIQNDGPVIIDKSPFYLDNIEILNLILEYKNRGNTVKFIEFIRHPLDAITSQEENGKYRLGFFSIDEREMFYLKRYNNLGIFKQSCNDLTSCKYEDLLYDSKSVLKSLEDFLGFEIKETLFRNKCKTGRYNLSCNYNVRNWMISSKLKSFILKNNYPLKPVLLKRNILPILFNSFKNEFRARYYTLLFKLFKDKV